MKIFFAQDALINAGSEKSHLEIISRFSGKTDASMVYFYPRHDLREEYIHAGIKLHFLDLKGSYDFMNGVRKLVKLIREEKPDLLVSCLYRADIMTRIASIITGVPVVGTLVNDSYGEYSRKDKKGIKHNLVWLLDKWTAGIPIHWIANAQSLVESHVKTLGLKREKISVVYRGRQVPPPRSVSPQTETTEKKIMACEDTVHGEVPVIARTAGTKQSDSGEQRIEIERLVDKRPEMERLSVNKNKNDEKGAFRFLSYGRLLERKGFQEAILAFSQVVKQYPNCTLTIYGEGVFRKKLEDLVASLGLEKHVTLPGKFGGEERETEDGRRKTEEAPNSTFRELEGEEVGPKTEYLRPMAPNGYLDGTPNLQSLVSQSPNPLIPNSQSLNFSSHNLLLQSDCFLFPSWYEGFSGALVEAMMAGIPIIASDIPMNLEAVTADKNALTFPVKDVESLVQKMLFAIENPDRMAELGKAARVDAIERFNIDIISKQYEGTLMKIYQQRKSNKPG